MKDYPPPLKMAKNNHSNDLKMLNYGQQNLQIKEKGLFDDMQIYSV